MFIQFSNSAQDNPSNGVQSLKEAIASLSTYSSRYGLTNESLLKIIKALINPDLKIPLQFKIAIIRDHLYPRTLVSSNIVATIVGIKHEQKRRVHTSVHSALLRWLVVVYAYLQDPQIIAKLYSALLTRIPYESTRQWICHLLFLSTSQATVTQWRAQLLIEYYTKFPGSQYIVALLRLYKSYAPFLFNGNLALVRATLFRHPNVEMEDAILLIQEASRSTISKSDASSNHQRANLFSRKSKRNGSKSRRSAQEQPNGVVIPPIRATLSSLSAYQPRLGVENITSTNQFVSSFHKLKFPDQMGSVFSNGSGMLIRLLQYKGKNAEWDRFNSWLLQQLYDTFQRGAFPPASTTAAGKQVGPATSIMSSASSRIGLRYYFEKIVLFYTYTKLLPFAAEEFLYEYLAVWDGVQHADLMYKLISFLPMNFHEFVEDRILEPLKRVIVSNYYTKQLWVFQLLTQLLRNWRLQILTGMVNTESINLMEQCRTLRSMVCFVDYYGLFAVEKFKDNVTVAMSILSFFKEIAMFPNHSVFPVVLSMSSDLLYHLFMSRSGVVLSHCSDLLVRWKPLHLTSINSVREKPLDRSVQYQGYVLDFCNSIWLNKAFEVTKKSAPDTIAPSHFSLHPNFIKILKAIAAKYNFSISTLFGISHSLIFLRQAGQFFQELEEKNFNSQDASKKRTKDGALKAGPLRLMEPPTYASLKAHAANGGLDISYVEFRVLFLDHLEENGYTGLYALLYSSMRKLMERKSSSNTGTGGASKSSRTLSASSNGSDAAKPLKSKRASKSNSKSQDSASFSKTNSGAFSSSSAPTTLSCQVPAGGKTSSKSPVLKPTLPVATKSSSKGKTRTKAA